MRRYESVARYFDFSRNLLTLSGQLVRALHTTIGKGSAELAEVAATLPTCISSDL